MDAMMMNPRSYIHVKQTDTATGQRAREACICTDYDYYYYYYYYCNGPSNFVLKTRT